MSSSPFYITTPIYYPNSAPHLGHAYTTIVADVVSRYQRMMDRKTFFVTGTDEHGSKIAEAAEAAGEDPQSFTDRISQRFSELLKPLDAKNDFFIRTTDAEHQQFVQKMATIMYEKGDLYEAEYSGWYCTACERYFKESELLDSNSCPIHRREVKHMTESNWFFRLSAYKERLLEHYRNNPDWIQPRSRYNEAIALIDQLEDLSVSRSSISWGVPVPWDQKQVFYVWIDALFNYASALTYAQAPEDLTKVFWPPNVQIMAKDILKFHAVYWPAFLMSVGLELPQMLFVHGYLTVGGDKMGKSMGNALDPFPLIDRFGADPIRFYLFREVNFGQDGAVSQEGFERRYDTELVNDLGNLVSRTAAMLVKYKSNSHGAALIPSSDQSSTIAKRATDTLTKWTSSMDRYDLSGALESVWSFVRALNQHVEVRAPWQLAKDESKAELLDATLAELCEGLIAITYMLSPFMPKTSTQIAGIFGVDQDKLVAGWSWGQAAGAEVVKPEPLFPRREAVALTEG